MKIIIILILLILFSGCVTININTLPSESQQISTTSPILINTDKKEIIVPSLIGTWKNEEKTDMCCGDSQYLKDCYYDKNGNKFCKNINSWTFNFDKNGTGYMSMYMQYRGETDTTQFSYKIINDTAFEIISFTAKNGTIINGFGNSPAPIFTYKISNNTMEFLFQEHGKEAWILFKRVD